MAEFKTYVCDVCGIQGAKRFTIERVDFQVDPADGNKDSIDGDVDLCLEHTAKLQDEINWMLCHYEADTVFRREVWKRLFGVKYAK